MTCLKYLSLSFRCLTSISPESPHWLIRGSPRSPGQELNPQSCLRSDPHLRSRLRRLRRPSSSRRRRSRRPWLPLRFRLRLPLRLRRLRPLRSLRPVDRERERVSRPISWDDGGGAGANIRGLRRGLSSAAARAGLPRPSLSREVRTHPATLSAGTPAPWNLPSPANVVRVTHPSRTVRDSPVRQCQEQSRVGPRALGREAPRAVRTRNCSWGGVRRDGTKKGRVQGGGGALRAGPRGGLYRERGLLACVGGEAPRP